MRPKIIPEGVSIVPDEEIDPRTDEEILKELREYVAPSESNKNVWAYWRTGLDSMPPWAQRNVINWARLLKSSKNSDPWTIRVVDFVPGSINNVSRFLDQEKVLPPVFYKAEMTGPYVGAHSGNLVRLPLLHRYGGVWLDATAILIRHLDDIWEPIEDTSSPYELFGMGLPLRNTEMTFANSIIATKRHNEYIERWHRVYLELWNNNSECVDFHAHPLLKHLRLFLPPNEANAPDVPQSAKAYTDYLAHMLCGERVRDLIDTNDGFNGRLYYETKVYLLSALQEQYLFPKLNGWNGNNEFKTLITHLDDQDQASVQSAKDIVCNTLQNSCLVKLSHGVRGSSVPWLAQLWNQPENIGSDNAPGTFAEYLRRGALYFRQNRKLKPLELGQLTAKVWSAGLLEPCGDRDAKD